MMYLGSGYFWSGHLDTWVKESGRLGPFPFLVIRGEGEGIQFVVIPSWQLTSGNFYGMSFV